ncbi:MAG: glycosyltransferase family 2 protein [Firmicutes bacterium]|nr:glycosyltransferase family 2 protein [Bacillota bacterium]
MDLISVIVPCFNEQEALPYFYEEINKVSQKMNNSSFEFLFVDDGSKDRTLSILKELAQKDERVKYISFSRNFGKEAAIYAGFENCKGDYAVMMDADLQDPPSLLPEMLRWIKEEGYDSVATRRGDREGEPPIRSFFAKLFYKIINKISDADIVDGARDYRLMSRQMVDTILSMGEYNRFSKGIFGWIGFKTKWIEFKNVERVAGQTKWSFWKLFKYSLEGITAFSVAPLQIASLFGVFFSFVAFVMIVVIIIKTLVFGDPVGGWPSMACIVMMIGGIQLLSIGVLGQYLAKAYMESKHRPLYIARETNTKK